MMLLRALDVTQETFEDGKFTCLQNHTETKSTLRGKLQTYSLKTNKTKTDCSNALDSSFMAMKTLPPINQPTSQTNKNQPPPNF